MYVGIFRSLDVWKGSPSDHSIIIWIVYYTMELHNRREDPPNQPHCERTHDYYLHLSYITILLQERTLLHLLPHLQHNLLHRQLNFQ